MPRGQVYLFLARAIGCKSQEITVRRKGRMFVPPRSERYLTFLSRHKVLHEDAMPLIGQGVNATKVPSGLIEGSVL